jgi:hypothetical protein
MPLTTTEIVKLFYPDIASDLTDNQISAYINIVSAVISSYCQRDFSVADITEWKTMFGSNTVILDRWPVNKIYGVVAQTTSYATINITNANNIPVTLSNNGSVMTLYKSLAATSPASITLSTLTTTTLVTAIEAILAGLGQTYSHNIVAQHASKSALLLLDPRITTGADSMIIDLVGLDFASQIDSILESERILVLNQTPQTGTGSLVVKYNAGYTLPTGSDFGTLPLEINDIANRMVWNIANFDVIKQYDMSVTEEKLGDASVKYSTASAKTSYIRGLLTEFADQLSPYVRKNLGQ